MPKRSTAPYPRYVPSPDPTFKGHKIRVADEAEHEKANASDFADFQKELDTARSMAESGPDQSTLSERERCAHIAEMMQPGNQLGNKIAQIIRKGTPLVVPFKSS